MDFKKEKSCGCIIINNGKVLLIYQKNGNFWGFPNDQFVIQENEIENAKWCNFEEALKTLTFEDWREMFRKVINDLN